jgi:hypothetical protein
MSTFDGGIALWEVDRPNRQRRRRCALRRSRPGEPNIEASGSRRAMTDHRCTSRSCTIARSAVCTATMSAFECGGTGAKRDAETSNRYS